MESLIYGPRPSIPAWLQTIERRIRDSVLPQAQTENDGRWVNPEIAAAGIDFFERTADLLTGEPFIYSSCRGDLIAEFSAEHGTMTSVVSSNFVLLFAVVDKVPIERTITERNRLRDEVQHLTELLSTGQNGTVGTAG